MTTKEEDLGNRMHKRWEELMRTTDLSNQEAQSQTQREFANEIRELETSGSEEIEGRVLWKGSRAEVEEDDEKSYEEQPVERSDEEIVKETVDKGKEKYLKTREKVASGLRKAEAIGKGIIGVGSRRPIKEALISGTAKVIEALKSKPKSPEEIKREKRYRAEEEHARRMTEAKYSRRTRGEKTSILRDIGRGDMGSREFGTTRDPVGSLGSSKTPDFLGSESFNMGTRNPLGKSKVKSPMRPPSTSIPYGGNIPPSVSLGKTQGSVNDLVNLRPVKKGNIKQKNVPKKSTEQILGLEGYF